MAKTMMRVGRTLRVLRGERLEDETDEDDDGGISANSQVAGLLRELQLRFES